MLTHSTINDAVKRLEQLSNTFVDGMFSGPLTEPAIQEWTETKRLAAQFSAYINTRNEEEFKEELEDAYEIIERQAKEHRRRLKRLSEK